MSINRLPKSDRVIILILFGLITILVIFIHHKSQQPFNAVDTETTLSGSWHDSLAYFQEKRKDAKEKRERRYLAIRDSFAQLRILRELKKQEREARYLALKDSFSRLKAERERRKEERELIWQHRRDSIQALYPQKLIKGETIELNSADTLQLMKIPGIGKGLASTIVHYRNQLGGFYQKEQILEIGNIPADVLSYLTLSGTPKKININKLSVNQLRKHPYLNFYQAKAINDYRQKYGKIQDIQQLSLLDEFRQKDLIRLQPYVSY